MDIQRVHYWDTGTDKNLCRPIVMDRYTMREMELGRVLEQLRNYLRELQTDGRHSGKRTIREHFECKCYTDFKGCKNGNMQQPCADLFETRGDHPAMIVNTMPFICEVLVRTAWETERERPVECRESVDEPDDVCWAKYLPLAMNNYLLSAIGRSLPDEDDRGYKRSEVTVRYALQEFFSDAVSGNRTRAVALDFANNVVQKQTDPRSLKWVIDGLSDDGIWNDSVFTNARGVSRSNKTSDQSLGVKNIQWEFAPILRIWWILSYLKSRFGKEYNYERSSSPPIQLEKTSFAYAKTAPAARPKKQGC